MIQYPDTVYIGITDKCNANCVICWRRAVKQEFLDFDSSLLDKVMPFLQHVKHIGWWGDGEIFSHGDILHILDVMKSLPNVSHSFSTNGKKLAEYANILSSINISELIISIDGATEGTLSRIRVGVKLEDIRQGICQIQNCFTEKEAVTPKLIFAFTSMMSNIYELPMLVELAHSLLIDEIRVQPLNPHHSDLEAEDLSWVAPGLERQYFDKARILAGMYNIKFNHCDPARVSL